MEIRLIADGEEEACNNFFNRIYKTNRKIRQWKWEFSSNNYDKKPVPYAVALDNGNVIGTQAFIPIRMIDKDGIYWTAKSEQTLVDPNYRGKKIFEKMYDIFFDYAKKHDFAYIWGFTSAVKPLRRLDFVIPYNTSQLFIPFSNRSIRTILEKGPGKKEGLKDKVIMTAIRLGAVVAKIASSMRIAASKKYLRGNFDIRTMDKPSDQMAGLCKRFINKWGGTTIYRDSQYMQWRVFDNPYVKSVVRGLYNQDELLGWVAFTLSDDGLGSVVDMMIPGDDSRYENSNLIKALLLEAVIGTRNMGASGIRAWHVNNHPFDNLIFKAAKKIGFYHIKKGNSTVIYNCEAAARRISYHKYDDWFISRIYTEGTSG
jgi:hypothetical protein